MSASAAIAFSKLANLTSAHILVGSAGNVATDVAVTGDISLTNAGVTAYSGVVPLNKGGTGTAAASANAAFNALSPLTTKGDLLSFSTVNARLGVGTDGDVLTADSGQTLGVKWATPTTGTVTSVALSVPATSIFGVSGSPVTTSGTLGLTTTGTSGGIPYFSSTSALSSSALLTANALVLGGGAATTPASLGSLGTTTTVLHGNAAGAPTFGAVSLTADISGTLAIGNGGTGQTSKAAAFDALSPMTTGGDIIYGGASGTGTRLANGTAGQYLASAGTTSPPVWTSLPTVFAWRANTSTTAATTAAPFIYTTVERDDGSCYNNSTGVATIPAGGTGWYIIIGSAYVGATTMDIRIVINGTAQVQGVPQSSIVQGACVTAVYYLTAGDTVEIRPAQNATASGGKQLNHFEGIRVH